jgi:hypothetical protein
MKTVKDYREQSILSPQRINKGPRSGELAWSELLRTTAVRTLYNPRYAGAFCFGRTRQRRRADGGAESCNGKATTL